LADFKAAYMGLYQQKLELAAGLKMQGLLPEEMRSSEEGGLKAFQAELVEKGKPPPVPTGEPTEEEEQIEYPPLATRCERERLGKAPSRVARSDAAAAPCASASRGASLLQSLPARPARRAAAAAVAKLDAKKLKRAEKKDKKKSPLEKFLAKVPTLDHVASPTGSLLKSRFKPMLRRSEAYPLLPAQ
jgi:hypothetical protein